MMKTKQIYLAALFLISLAPSAWAHIGNNVGGDTILPSDGAQVRASGGRFAVQANFRAACDVPSAVREEIMDSARVAKIQRNAWSCSNGNWRWQGEVVGARPGSQITVIVDFESQGWSRSEQHIHGLSASYTVR